MKYPKYLYRGTTTNYIGPLGMINVDESFNRMYFSESLDQARRFAYIHKAPRNDDWYQSFPGGKPVIVTVKVDSDLASKLHRGRSILAPEWWAETTFISRKNIVKIEPI